MSKRADEHVIRIHDGQLDFVYADDLAELLTLGTVANIRRVSHVEPAPGGGWTADMSPVGGPVLGPFALRQTALDAERDWLREERGL